MIYSARCIQNTYITVFKTPEANGIESEEEEEEVVLFWGQKKKGLVIEERKVRGGTS